MAVAATEGAAATGVAAAAAAMAAGEAAAMGEAAAAATDLAAATVVEGATARAAAGEAATAGAVTGVTAVGAVTGITARAHGDTWRRADTGGKALWAWRPGMMCMVSLARMEALCWGSNSCPLRAEDHAPCAQAPGCCHRQHC